MKQLLITKLQNKHECALQYIQNSNQFLSISIINLGITLDNIQLSSIQSFGSWCMHIACIYFCPKFNLCSALLQFTTSKYSSSKKFMANNYIVIYIHVRDTNNPPPPFQRTTCTVINQIFQSDYYRVVPCY